jgi:putative transposase
MLLSIKTKLKLNKSQKQLMAKHAGIARFTYNWGLATWKSFDESGLKPNKYILKKFFNNFSVYRHPDGLFALSFFSKWIKSS